MRDVVQHHCRCGKAMKPMLSYKSEVLGFYCHHCGRAVIVMPKEIWFEHTCLEKPLKKDWEVTSRDI